MVAKVAHHCQLQEPFHSGQLGTPDRFCELSFFVHQLVCHTGGNELLCNIAAVKLKLPAVDQALLFFVGQYSGRYLKVRDE